MIKNTLSLLIAGAALAACQPLTPSLEDADYWQKYETTEAIYQRGPKAQQVLFRDIARCTAELKELERMNVIAGAFDVVQEREPDYYEVQPADTYAYPDSQEKRYDAFNTPLRDGELIVEDGQYFDFETCMYNKGWARTEYVPYNTAITSQRKYQKSVEDYRFRSKYDPRERIRARVRLDEIERQERLLPKQERSRFND